MNLKIVILAGSAVVGIVAGAFGLNKDKFVFDSEGFNKDGFDRQGFNRHGYNKAGYNKTGYDSEGFDRNGYTSKGYNRSGKDRAGFTRNEYSVRIEKLKNRQKIARKKEQEHEYRHAISDARLVIEESLRLLIGHSLGADTYGDGFLAYLQICQNYNLIDDEVVDKLHGVRKIGNLNAHTFEYDEEVSHDKVHFVVMQALDLINILEEKLSLV